VVLSLLDKIHNRFSVPGFLVNSLPKAGTNLLAKVMTLFPGICPAHVHIGQSTLAQFRRPSDSQAVTVPVGVDWPQLVPLSAVRQSLQRLKGGHCATVHIPFSEEMATLWAEMGMRSLLILRDPRDVVVSHAYYVASTPNHFLFEFYQTLSESERILRSIIGVKQTTPNDPMLLNIYERCRNVLPWTSQSFNYTAYFERLVGPQGSGSRDAQIEELENIAQHLGIWYNPNDIEQIAKQIFGGTRTFRKGIIGDWRNHFSAEHKRVFKELAGQILINLGYEQNYDW
jgi:hypothetical protein